MSTPRLIPATPEDAGRIHCLFRDVEVHDREPLVTTPAEVTELLARPHFDPALDARLLVVDDAAVGFAWIHHTPSDTREDHAYLLGMIHPEHRRHGLGTILFRWEMQRATERLRKSPPGLPRYLRTSSWDWIPDAHHLYESHGFVPVRWYEELLMSLEEGVEVEPPRGVAILPWNAGPADEIRQVHNAAFADHWGSTPRDEATWNHELRGHGMRLDLSFVAVAADRVVGYSLNEVYPGDEELLGRRDGWIGTLGVLREWRGRGIASALIAASLDAFRSAGLSHASIGVDTDNPSGAARLYRRLGFRRRHRSVTHQREVAQ